MSEEVHVQSEAQLLRGTALAEMKRAVGEGMLKIDPKKRRDILSRKVFLKCNYAIDLAEKMGNLPVEICHADRKGHLDHIHICRSDPSAFHDHDEDIIADPSIRQFIPSAPNVFIGTRRELRELVLKAPEIINTMSKNNPQEAFERIWGNSSVKQQEVSGRKRLRNKDPIFRKIRLANIEFWKNAIQQDGE